MLAYNCGKRQEVASSPEKEVESAREEAVFLRSTPVRHTLEQMQPQRDPQGDTVSPAVAVKLFIVNTTQLIIQLCSNFKC